MTKCAYCEYNDGAVYTSDPPKYRCTVTGEYHLALDDCTVEFAPVVWCKDCKYSTPLTFYDKGVKGLFCNYRGSIGDWRYRTETDYCSRGERRENVKSDTDTDDI